MEAVMGYCQNQDRAALSVRWSSAGGAPVPLLRTCSKQISVGPAPEHIKRRTLYDRDESNPDRCAAELVQRGRLILDVSMADLEAAEAAFGAFHPTTWYFRNTLNEARRSWDRLRAELGSKVLEAALRQPPLMTLTLGEAAGGETKVILALI